MDSLSNCCHNNRSRNGAIYFLYGSCIKKGKRDKYAKIVHEELTKLGIEFQRYKERWDKLSRSIETVNKDVENLNITSDKISKKFEAISDVKLDNKKQLE